MRLPRATDAGNTPVADVKHLLSSGSGGGSLKRYHYKARPSKMAASSMTSERTTLTASSYVREDILDLPDQCQEVRIVVYGIIGQLCLLVHRNLKIFANFDFPFIREAPALEPVGSPVAVAFHKDQSITAVCPSNFDQQGHIKYNRFGMCTLIVLGNQFLGSLEYARMDHFVQRGQFLLIGKDKPGQFPAVDLGRKAAGSPVRIAHIPDREQVLPSTARERWHRR